MKNRSNQSKNGRTESLFIAFDSLVSSIAASWRRLSLRGLRQNIVQTIPPKSKTLKVMIKIAVIFKI